MIPTSGSGATKSYASRMNQPAVPSARALAFPVLEVVRGLGGSATIPEITEGVAKYVGLTEDQQAIPRGQGRTEVEYRLAWARTRLKILGLLTNSKTGVWSITDLGHSIKSAAEVDARYKAYRLAKKQSSDQAPIDLDASVSTEPEEELELELGPDGPADPDAWRDALLQTLKAMPPDAFERLAQRLMREAGFSNVNVLGKTGDGGIDGVGTFRQSLVSWTVFFQCKRYAGSVSAGAVRDFRGAMSGRGEKGLLITTGTFTASAKTEASRDGAPTVDLVDGARLCDLLREKNLGVTSVQREEYDVTVDPAFFEGL